MRLPVLFHPKAPQDLMEARAWYNGQRRGLGSEFVREVRAALDRVSDSPLLYDFVTENVRSCVMHRFPYVIYFRSLADHIEVLAVLHGSRDPAVWQRRIP